MYLESHVDGAEKFWNIRRDGKTVVTQYGKIGTPGRRNEKDYDDAIEATVKFWKAINSKLKKGYLLATRSSANRMSSAVRRFSEKSHPGMRIEAVGNRVRLFDPFGFSSEFDIGTSSCQVSLHSLELRDDKGEINSGSFLLASFGEGPVVQWHHGPGGGIDSGVMAIWTPGLKDIPECDGVLEIEGRIFALSTGDCGLGALIGCNAKNEKVALVMGPGVEAGRFGIATEVASDDGEEQEDYPFAGPVCPVFADLAKVLWQTDPGLAYSFDHVALAKSVREARVHATRRQSLFNNWVLGNVIHLVGQDFPEIAELVHESNTEEAATELVAKWGEWRRRYNDSEHSFDDVTKHVAEQRWHLGLEGDLATLWDFAWEVSTAERLFEGKPLLTSEDVSPPKDIWKQIREPQS